MDVAEERGEIEEATGMRLSAAVKSLREILAETFESKWAQMEM